jgi:drug/metabolite transporter (DMT)-like permease
VLGIAGALLAAICYGTATVLQAVAAANAPRADGLDPRLLLRVLRQLPFVVGVLLDGAGFLLSLAALRQLPLFVVEAIIAGNLAVAALVAARVLHLRLLAREWAAVGAVCAGLVLLVLSAGEQAPVHVGRGFETGLLVTTLILAATAGAAGRVPGGYGSAALGFVAGLGYGVVGVAVRVLTDLSPGQLVRNPAAYALPLAAGLAFLAYLTALQRGRVTTATGPLVVAETVAPALVGVVALGDAARPGYALVGLAGFVLAGAGAVALARFGSLQPVDAG